MEQAAKDIDSGKDAFGLAVIKRSGEVNSSVYKWRADNQWLPQIYNELVGHLQRRDFSPFFIRYLSLSLSRLISDDGYFEGDEQIVKAEIKRLVGRASLLTEKKKENMRAFGDGGDATTITIEEMVNKVEMLYKNSQSQGISNFLDALNIVAFLERVMEP
jgi:CRISPR-associated protein Cmr2